MKKEIDFDKLPKLNVSRKVLDEALESIHEDNIVVPVAPAPTASAEESKDKILNVKFVNEAQMIRGGLERAIKMIRKLHPKCEGGAWCACKICSDSDLMAAEFISESFTESELSAYASSQSEKLKGVGRQAAEEIWKLPIGGVYRREDYAEIIDRVIAGRVKP